jgi:ATP-binding cassette subfamily B (MDR/TAP) protein 1
VRFIGLLHSSNCEPRMARRKFFSNPFSSSPTTTPSSPSSPMKEEKHKEPVVSYYQLFRYADYVDITIILVATMCSTVSGLTLPFMTVVFGDITQVFYVFVSYLYSGSPVPSSAETNFNNDILYCVYGFCLIGACSFFMSFLATSLWMWSGERQSRKLRKAYLRALLSQELGWYDQQKTGELSSRISANISSPFWQDLR